MKKKSLNSIITVSETGRVGINQPNPIYQLDIRGGVRIEAIGTAAPNAPGIYLISHGNEVNHGGYIGYRHAHSGAPDFDLIQGSMYGQSSENWNIVVYPTGVMQSGSAAHIALTVDAQGCVGVQQPNPTAQLHVRGSVRMENLPKGKGAPLMIDEHGNLSKGLKKRSKKEVDEIEVLRASVQRLENEVQMLKQLLLNLKTKTDV
jgi:hypothetical protein